MKIEYTKTPRDVVEFDDDVPANLDPTDIVEIFPNTFDWFIQLGLHSTRQQN